MDDLKKSSKIRWEDIKIEKGIPIPPRRRRRKTEIAKMRRSLANPIELFFHCDKCCDEKCEYPGDKSVGYTSDGKLTMWCEIHDSLVHTWELKNPPDFVCDECVGR
jgi:hypothetical protein